MPTPSPDQPLRTPLYSLHVELGAKMVPFAGYAMPVQYPDGVLKEHLHTRAQAGLFDVSHMGQVVARGAGIAAALEKLIPVDIEALPLNKQSYGVFTADHGGILDDLIITRWGENEFFLVVNAGCKARDIAHLQQHLTGFDVEVLEDRALLALQGPQAATVMTELVGATSTLTFMNGCRGNIDGADCFITRSGYTGEDGFEISIPADRAVAVAKRLLSYDAVQAIGLGARDSLRLEAGLCLYGHDMDSNTSPIEAGLTWSISKSRRSDGSKAGGFLGAEKILEQISRGAPRKRVGLKINGRAPIREGVELVDKAGAVIGKVTSGGFGPTLGAPLAMAYVDSEHASTGSELGALLRGKTIPVEVVKMPFVAQNYVR